MNISNFKDLDYESKQEDDGSSKIVAKPNLTTTSSWSRLKDPRIVRVSRAFGGKDRHSKVCTVRGLRDRRVRLSVPTAIQLYDLQDRLGLNQPSKVVDWLLDAAKTEIDELPPLQIPPGIGQNLQAMINASNSSSQQISAKSTSINWEDYWNPDHKSKAIARENCEDQDQEDAARNLNKHDYHHHGSRFFQSSSNSSNLTGLLNNVDPNTCFLKWDPSSNLSLSQLGSSSYGSHEHQHINDNNVHNFNMNVAAAAALTSIPSGSLYHPPQPPPQTQSYFPSSHNNNSEELNYQTASYGMRPFHLSMNPKFFSSEDNINGGPHQSNK